MTIIFSFGIQKGGVGTTTTTGITSWLLSEKFKKKVLAVDFDSQGNLTQLLTGNDDLSFYKDKTVLQACKEKNPRPYIQHITENLHILSADDFISSARYLFNDYQRISDGKKHDLSLLLKEILAVVSSEYDYILSDLPTNLSEQTINGISASDFCIVVLQAEPFCYNALENYLEILITAQEEVNPNMKVIDILTSIIDQRNGVGQVILEKTQEEYGDLVFNTVIQRRARVAEFAITGIENRVTKDREALSMYESFIKELMNRVAQYQREAAATSQPVEVQQYRIKRC